MNYAGGGYKINLLKRELEAFKDKDDLIVLFTDSYDVVITAKEEQIVETFKRNFDGARIVFGAEGFCWPDEKLTEKYPEISAGYRFLNSGGFIGYADALYDLVAYKEIDNKGDDQLYYTKIFLDEKLRESMKIELDHKAELFQNLNGALNDVELRFEDSKPFLRNVAFETNPLVIHGNGPTKLAFNGLANYIPSAWNKDDQCTSCWEDVHGEFDDKFGKDEKVPKVVIGLFVLTPTPFLEEFFVNVQKFNYPKDKVHVYIHNEVEEHDDEVEAFLEANGKEFASFERTEKDVKEWKARNGGLDKCVEVECDYYFSLDSEAHIDNPFTLKLLIEQNRNVVAPMLVRPYKAWSNFWGALTSEGKLIFKIFLLAIEHSTVTRSFDTERTVLIR